MQTWGMVKVGLGNFVGLGLGALALAGCGGSSSPAEGSTSEPSGGSGPTATESSDPSAATDTIYGGLIASGWHTGSMLMRCLVDHFISPASLGSPGVENIRWPVPVRPGDVLRVRATVTDSRRSRTKPDRGILVSRYELINQHEQTVMEMSATNFIRCRDGG